MGFSTSENHAKTGASAIVEISVKKPFLSDGKGKICRIIRCAYACPQFSKLLQEYEAGGKDAVMIKSSTRFAKDSPQLKSCPTSL